MKSLSLQRILGGVSLIAITLLATSPAEAANLLAMTPQQRLTAAHEAAHQAAMAKKAAASQAVVAAPAPQAVVAAPAPQAVVATSPAKAANFLAMTPQQRLTAAHEAAVAQQAQPSAEAQAKATQDKAAAELKAAQDLAAAKDAEAAKALAAKQAADMAKLEKGVELRVAPQKKALADQQAIVAQKQAALDKATATAAATKSILKRTTDEETKLTALAARNAEEDLTLALATTTKNDLTGKIAGLDTAVTSAKADFDLEAIKLPPLQATFDAAAKEARAYAPTRAANVAARAAEKDAVATKKATAQKEAAQKIVEIASMENQEEKLKAASKYAKTLGKVEAMPKELPMEDYDTVRDMLAGLKDAQLIARVTEHQLAAEDQAKFFALLRGVAADVDPIHSDHQKLAASVLQDIDDDLLAKHQ